MNERISQLIKLKKFAEKEGPLTGDEIKSLDVYITAAVKRNGEDYVKKVVLPLASETFRLFNNSSSFSLDPLYSGPRFTDHIVKYIASYLLQRNQPGFFTISIIRPKYGIYGNAEQLKPLQTQLEKTIVEARNALPDPDKWNRSTTSSKSTDKKEGGRDSARTQATSGTVALTDVGSLKEEVTNKGDIFTYTINEQYKFTYTWKNRDGVVQNGKENIVITPKSYSGWNNTATKINAMEVKISAPTEENDSGGPEATKNTPAATPEQAPAQTEVPANNLLTNVARLLSNVDAGHTYAGKTIFTNEKGMVRRMLAEIKKMPKKGVVDAPLALAKVIVGMAQTALNNTSLATTDPSVVAGMKEKEIEKSFRTELDIIMRGVVGLYNDVKSDFTRLSAYIVVKAPKEANFLDSRIKKLAKLRRLRVRAQMEAAIETSAKFGRSRVF